MAKSDWMCVDCSVKDTDWRVPARFDKCGRGGKHRKSVWWCDVARRAGGGKSTTRTRSQSQGSAGGAKGVSRVSVVDKRKDEKIKKLESELAEERKKPKASEGSANLGVPTASITQAREALKAMRAAFGPSDPLTVQAQERLDSEMQARRDTLPMPDQVRDLEQQLKTQSNTVGNLERHA